MKRIIGTNAMGIRMPIVRSGDNLVEIVSDRFVEFVQQENFNVEERDIIAVTESLLARAQGNYCSIYDIVKDVNSKYDDEISIVFPILSRNRFLNILRAFALTGKKIKIFLSYPSDEVGNLIMDRYEIKRKNINIYQDTLTEEDYFRVLGKKYLHPFTNMDYVEIYKDLAVNDNIEILYSNNLKDIASRSKAILVANIHDREYLKEYFKSRGIEKVYSLQDVMTHSIDGSGYNPEYGLYGSNLSGEDTLKLFPRDAKEFVENLREEIYKKTGTQIEVMVYGDGAFKDPVGRIWELADPVVSPGYTEGLKGRPNEIKIKYLADNEMSDKFGEEAEKAIIEKIKSKEGEVEESSKLGTTPRQLTDLIGSLCDLMSGSGDKGTPVIYIKGYFDNFSTE